MSVRHVSIGKSGFLTKPLINWRVICLYRTSNWVQPIGSRPSSGQAAGRATLKSRENRAHRSRSSRKAANNGYKRGWSPWLQRYCLSVRGRKGNIVVEHFRNAVAALSFTTVAGSNFLWGFMDDYLGCVLALVASFIAASCIERAFVRSAHREMARIYGADWGYADNDQPRPLIKLFTYALVIILIVGVLSFDQKDLLR